MYNKNKNNQGTGPQGKYYRSKNGRVYYRDAQGKAHWVSPPSQGIYVPQQEAEIYRNRAREFSYPGSNAVPGPSGY
ncbi:MAG: hypothetical protein KY468_10425 [Armatimonadetes bacterium]|nr:hypothetical protein [Armatimonadota bacterium]